MAVTHADGSGTPNPTQAVQTHLLLREGEPHCSKQVSLDLSVWVNDRTRLVMIGPDGDMDIPAATTAEGVISVTTTNYCTRDLEVELLGVSGKRLDVHTYSSTLIALNDALEDWARNLIAALEH